MDDLKKLTEPSEERLMEAYKHYVDPTGAGYTQERAKDALKYLEGSMGDNTNKAYELLEKQRQKNVLKNIAEGRSMSNMSAKGTPADMGAMKNTADTLSNVVDKNKDAGGFVKQLEGTRKVADDSIGNIGLNSELRAKRMLGKMGAEDAGLLTKAEGVAGELAPTAGKLLKGSEGFAKLIPMLGMGALAAGAMPIVKEASNGHLKDAAVDTADLATDFIPSTLIAKTALNSPELNPNEEDDLKKAQNQDTLEMIRSLARKKSAEAGRSPAVEPTNSEESDNNQKFNTLINRLNRSPLQSQETAIKGLDSEDPILKNALGDYNQEAVDSLLERDNNKKMILQKIKAQQ